MGLTVGLPQCDSPFFFRRRKKKDENICKPCKLCDSFGEKIVISHSSQILIYLQSKIVKQKQETERFEITY